MLMMLLAALGASGPSALAVPPDARLALSAVGRGDQVYRCSAQANGTAFGWTLVGPDAVLFNAQGRRIGRHFAGPTWQAADGSKVTGLLRAKSPSPDHRGVDWLLLSATANSGRGVFGDIRYIRRLDTRGGAAPGAGCDAAAKGRQVRERYSAEYEFYAPRPSPAPRPSAALRRPAR